MLPSLEGVGDGHRVTSLEGQCKDSSPKGLGEELRKTVEEEEEVLVMIET